MAEIRCQMCGKPNPEEAEVCQYCQARLKPLIAQPPFEEPPTQPIRPGEQPQPQDTSELERMLPDWLRSLHAQAEEEPERDVAPSEAEAAEEQPPLTEAGEGDELDWLRSLASLDAEEAEAAPTEEEGAEWLAALGEESPAAAEEVAPAEEVDWLARLGTEPAEQTVPVGQAAEEGDEAAPSAPEEGGEEAVPDWLAAFQQETPAEAEPPTEEALPDWLREMQPAAEGEGAPAFEGEEAPERPEEGPAEAPVAEEAADWLQGLESAAPAEAEAAPVGEELPDWLQEIAQSAAEEAPSPEETPAEPSAASPEERPDEEEKTEPLKAVTGVSDSQPVPDWLQELEEEGIEAPEEVVPPLDFSAPLEAEGAQALEDLEDFSLEELPDWLTEVGDLEEVAPPAKAGEAESEEALAPAELPAWLEAMRPVEAVAAEPGAEEPEGEVVEYGPLAGLRGVLPAEVEMAYVRKPPPYSVKLQVEERQQQRVALLQNLLTTETNAAGLPAPTVLPAQRLFRWLVTLVLFLAILVPVFLGTQQVALPALVPPETLAVSRLVRDLPAQAPVLVAFDYAPGFSGELEAAAQPVLGDLMQKEARLTLISTLPSGQAQAERMLSKHLAAFHYTSPDRYLNLGYLPGGSVGLRHFAHFPTLSRPFDVNGQPVWGNPQNALHDVHQIGDFALLLVIVDDPGVAQSWVEQVGPSLGDTPLVMVVSAQAEPLVRPYYETAPAQVQGMITGLEGGAAYAALIQQPGLPRLYWDGLAMGAVVAEVLMLLGSLFYFGLGWWSRRRATQA